MSEKYDYLIVGAGPAGCVCARKLADRGKKVLVIDRRIHIAGNCYDYEDENGVLVHKYGPHYFRTNDQEVFDYLSKFTKWRMHEYRVRASVGGKLYPIPINRDTLNMFFGAELETEEDAREFLDSKKVRFPHAPRNAEEQVLSTAGREVYGAFFKNYTRKQWGCDAKELDASVTARIDIRTNTDDRYFTDRIQAVPQPSFTNMFAKMLESKNIAVKLNSEYRDLKNSAIYEKLIFTGCIDEYFGFKYGKLPYRSLRFELERHEMEFYQDWSQINYPNDFDYTRIVEIKHVTGQRLPRTTIVKEFPAMEGEPYYPIPKEETDRIFQKYLQEAEKEKNVLFVGRLAQYKYFNTDRVVREALDAVKNF